MRRMVKVRARLSMRARPTTRTVRRKGWLQIQECRHNQRLMTTTLTIGRIVAGVSTVYEAVLQANLTCQAQSAKFR